MPEQPVKRRYDAARRRRDAAARRGRVVEVARTLFTSQGFSRTTVAEVAASAEVSPETIYKAFGGKAGLVRHIWASALAGAGSEHAERRADAAAAAAASGTEIIQAWLRLALEVAPRASAVLALVRSAAEVDPEAAALLDEIERGRSARMLHNARALADTGHLRADLSVEAARDLLLVFSGDIYDRLVLRAGWDAEDYVATMTRVMAAALIQPG
ncbi:transcriptional regulator, TetR family [Agrococcus baldri]|uniref:Transcriptional regulator, TetR family n=1 Tax=Agrococcus baldri TaxID=153730 RepID=A0AA94KZL1_9MICO|nr:TetR/AcrR family transcriptional regulator [Agrococcus baldri]SFS09868.1 transcriptional regulator, TetR family [Agrococcus baldri]